jgi:hypothetical protein
MNVFPGMSCPFGVMDGSAKRRRRYYRKERAAVDTPFSSAGVRPPRFSFRRAGR